MDFVLPSRIHRCAGECLLAGLVLSACAVTEPPATDPVSYGEGPCAGRGSDHAGAITRSITWTAEDGPHRVTGTLMIGSYPDSAVLTIQPGAVICFGPDASIATSGSGLLLATGTADAPITFTSNTGAGRWSGIMISDLNSARSHIEHAVVQYASHGIIGQGPVDIEQSLIRQITGEAIAFWYYNHESRISDTVVDSAGLDGTSPAISIGGGLLQNTVVSGSGATAISVTSRYALVRISGCDVYGSNGHGIVVEHRTTATVRINDCNLENNGGLGVENRSEVVADGRRNWWGDPAGPLGASGDGVSPKVDYSDFRIVPRAGASMVSGDDG